MNFKQIHISSTFFYHHKNIRHENELGKILLLKNIQIVPQSTKTIFFQPTQRLCILHRQDVDRKCVWKPFSAHNKWWFAYDKKGFCSRCSTFSIRHSYLNVHFHANIWDICVPWKHAREKEGNKPLKPFPYQLWVGWNFLSHVGICNIAYSPKILKCRGIETFQKSLNYWFKVQYMNSQPSQYLPNVFFPFSTSSLFR